MQLSKRNCHRKCKILEALLYPAQLEIMNLEMTQPEGILEDVLVKVGKFIFPMDIVVIDMEEDKQVPLLFGSPFLAIGAALINVKK